MSTSLAPPRITNFAASAQRASKVDAQALERTLAGVKRLDLNKSIGTELRGLNLLELDDEGVSAIKQLIAERGVLVFRDQPMTLLQQIAMGRRFGDLHVHPAFAANEYPEALRIHADANSAYAAGEAWHTDVSCDAAPPGISMLRIEVTPSGGGDTSFSSMYAAFEMLSKPMQQFLCTLQAVHDGNMTFQNAYKATKEPIHPVNVHPVVRTHPISGRRALYVNSGFTTRIKGVTGEESKTLLKMLFDHIAYGLIFQCRVRWEPQTLTMWDNRCVQHFASWDYYPETRSGWRVTTQGEIPVL